ncbi:HAMP domain-containing sensor histidine kinase [Paenibacillus senegalensis]|uniref:HAMP domain-containing sensor histidine kinase n=1 Tax=Paenibacillus senegalensis TaxID=1465766 RepID=UPI000288E226|nr:HAMP domain-containing sensor histidine kinase [Paenibacillus senegalensis]
MKQRTFLTTLVLFLIVFNLGIVWISVATYKDTVNRAKDTSLSGHYFIVLALLKDFQSLNNRNAEVDASLPQLLQPYDYLFRDDSTWLALYKGDTLLHTNLPVADPELLLNTPEPLEEGARRVMMREQDDRSYVIVTGSLPAPYEEYTLSYVHDTTAALNSWRVTKNTLFLAGFVLSSALALGLLLVLNRIFKPLTLISRTSRQIASGSYDTRLPVNGRDELSEMAQSFNHMAEEIQQRMTELKTAAEKKQQFIDNFAHEVRTPLTAIYGYAEYLQKAALSEKDKLAATGYIMSESRRLQTMAFQLLELANLRNDELVWEELDIAELIHSVKQTLGSKLTEKNIQWELRCEFKSIRGDACLLTSLFLNLVDNAVKACREGGTIQIHAYTEYDSKVVAIRDNGKGMAAGLLEHITEPFYRVEKSRNRKDGGAGLGLAICRQIADRHGAELRFASEPEKGTEASIIFTSSS